MSSDPQLRQRVKALLQNVINQRVYGKGNSGYGYNSMGNGLGYGGDDIYDYNYGSGDGYGGMYMCKKPVGKSRKLLGTRKGSGVLVGGMPIGGKKRKSGWIKYVKQYAAKHGISYKDALSEASASYNGKGLTNLY